MRTSSPPVRCLRYVTLVAAFWAAAGVSPQDLSDEGLDDLLGGEMENEAADGSREPSILRSWKGFVELKPRVYFFDRNAGKNNEQLLLESEFEFDFRFSDSLSGYFRPRIFLDALDGDLRRFEPYEAYLTWEGDSWDLRGGQFVENWGIVDTYNPIDIINRRDFATDILDPKRLGELGLRFRYLLDGNSTIGEPTFSLYTLPVFRETLFAPEDQRFGFGSEDLRFDEDDGFEPDGLEQGLYALRFQSTLNTKPINADVQLLAAGGPERIPTLTVASGELVPVYFGAFTFGGGFRAVPNQHTMGRFLSTLTLKAEVVYKKPYGFDDSPVPTPDEYVAYVLGVDRSFYNVIRDQDEITLTVEYAGEEGADDPASLLRPFRNDAILRSIWEVNDFNRTSVELRGIYDLDTDEIIFEAIGETQLRFVHEDLKLIAQLQLFDPPETGESFFDFFPDNSSLALGLRWEF